MWEKLSIKIQDFLRVFSDLLHTPSSHFLKYGLWSCSHSHSPEGLYLWKLSFSFEITRSSDMSVNQASVREGFSALLLKNESIKTLAFLLNQTKIFQVKPICIYKPIHFFTHTFNLFSEIFLPFYALNNCIISVVTSWDSAHSLQWLPVSF